MRLPRWLPRIEVDTGRGRRPDGAARLIIKVNSNAGMSRGKYAAQAVHAALKACGAHPGVPVVVLGAKPAELAAMPIQIHDAGLTEVAPGTLTAGARWDTGAGEPS